jgi:hypothetical protein
MDNNEVAYLQRALTSALARYPVSVSVKADLENTNEEDYIIMLSGTYSLRREYKSKLGMIEYSIIRNPIEGEIIYTSVRGSSPSSNGADAPSSSPKHGA